MPKQIEQKSVKHFPSLVMETFKLLAKKVEQEFLNHKVEVNLAEFLCLRHIASLDEAVSQQACASYLMKDKAAILRTIDVLEEKKFVKRVVKKSDRRVNLLSITAAGKKALNKAIKIDEAILMKIESEIKATEFKTFRNVLNQMQSHLSQ